MLNPKERLIIGIAGGTGSGKTTVARKLVESLPEGEAGLVQHDWYYRDLRHMSYEDRREVNFDEPAALDNELLMQHLTALKRGETIECPQYDYTTHLRAAATVLMEPRRIIVVEGILLFAIAGLRDRFDLRIYIDTDDDIRLMRRIKRDILTRGRDIESIQSQYYQTVRPMHRLYVAPSKDYAHLIIPEGGQNRRGLDVVIGRLKYFLATG